MQPILHCALMGLIVFIVKLPLASQVADIGIIGIAIAAGATVTTIKVFFFPSKRDDKKPWMSVKSSFALLTFIWFFIVVALNFSPYVFEADFEVVRHKLLHEANWLPFVAHVEHPSLNAAADIVRSVLLYAPIGFFMRILTTRTMTTADSNSRNI